MGIYFYFLKLYCQYYTFKIQQGNYWYYKKIREQFLFSFQDSVSRKTIFLR